MVSAVLVGLRNSFQPLFFIFMMEVLEMTIQVHQSKKSQEFAVAAAAVVAAAVAAAVVSLEARCFVRLARSALACVAAAGVSWGLRGPQTAQRILHWTSLATTLLWEAFLWPPPAPACCCLEVLTSTGADWKSQRS